MEHAHLFLSIRSVSSDCSYVMLRDAVASTFSIVYGVQKCDSRSDCKRYVNILVEDFVYELDTNGIIRLIYTYYINIFLTEFDLTFNFDSFYLILLLNIKR